MSLLSVSNRRTVRANVNPLDKATVVSILPKYIVEFKPTIQPGRFEIQEGSPNKPSLLVVGPSSWWREIDEEQPLIEIPVSAIQVADSIVKDYCNGFLACNMSTVMPGLFYLPGEISATSLLKDHKSSLLKAEANQKRWYEALVKLGDILWARSNGSPLSISDDMKLAAKELGLKEKSWLRDYVISTEMAPCPACGNLRNTQYPICQTCHTIIDKKKFEELGLQKAV